MQSQNEIKIQSEMGRLIEIGYIGNMGEILFMIQILFKSRVRCLSGVLTKQVSRVLACAIKLI